MKLRSLLVLLLAVAAPLFGQDTPNSMGFSFHHISFVVPDYDANVDFWTNLGATQQPMQGAVRFSLFHFTGYDVVVTVMENKDNSGGSVGFFATFRRRKNAANSDSGRVAVTRGSSCRSPPAAASRPQAFRASRMRS